MRGLLSQVAGWSVVAALTVAAVVLGLIVRRWAWDQTEPIRYTMDIDNAFRQGSEALRIGYIDRYDAQEATPDHSWVLDLDYAPGRLAIATLWSRWVREQVDGPINQPEDLASWPEEFYAHARRLHQQYQLCRPMLMVNITGELLSAVAMFLLVRRYASGATRTFKDAGRASARLSGHWRAEARPAFCFNREAESSMGVPPMATGGTPVLRGSVSAWPVRGIIVAWIAAALFWFNPALICNAHCWPQWDSWVLPFYLWALVLASVDWWFTAGVVIALGAMFKAQILFGAPLFLLWPLFQGRLPAVGRWVTGFLSGVAACTAVWLLRTPGKNPTGNEFIPGSIDATAVAWVIYLAMVFCAMVSLLRKPKVAWLRLPVGVLVAAVVSWMLAAYTGNPFSVVGFIVLAAAGWLMNDQFSQWGWRVRLPIAFAALVILVYPLYVLSRDWMVIVLLAAGAVGLLLWIAPARSIRYAAAGWIATALLLCNPVFGTSSGWFDLGIAYGTHHYERMASGANNNLAELLQQRWQWDDLMEPAFKLPKGKVADAVAAFLVKVDPGVHADRLHGQTGSNYRYANGLMVSRKDALDLKEGEVGVPLKYVLIFVWIVSVILCGIGAAMHDRDRSPRFLAAIATPWIMFFAVMTQMHQRYLLWGASLSAASVAISPGYVALHWFLSLVATSQELQSMMSQYGGRYSDNAVYRFIESWHPGVAWAVLLCAAIFLYTSLRRSPRPRR
jgi:hypothetical protein